jgi:Ca-activated chloride channel family protein
VSFHWPWALVALLAVPLLLAAYVWLQRRRRKYAVRYASLALIRDALPRHSRWRRHVPFALVLVGIAGLVLASARPQVTVAVPLSRTTIILALDASRSMCSTDVDPNRLSVASEAARTFVDDQPEGTRFGIVAFAGASQILVPPTTDRERLVEAIDGLVTSNGTAIGSAVLESIDALAEANPDVAPSTVDLDDEPGEDPPAEGEHIPDIIVLLTDGANTRGVDPLVAAEQAADRGARVFTIGFGTTESVPLVCTRDQLGGIEDDDPFGGGGGGPTGGVPGRYLHLDAPTLRTIADTTGGDYYRAEDAAQLVEVFDELPSQLEHQDEQREMSVGFVALAALLVTTAVGLSLWWNRYP